MYKNINLFFKQSHVIKVSIVLILASIPINLLFSKLEDLGVPNIHYHETIDKYNFSLPGHIFLSVLFGPIIETIVFQFLPFWILTKVPFIKKNYMIIIFLSALLFSLSHNYSIHYIIWAFIGGTFYMYLYIMRVGKHPFLTVLIIHAIDNLLSICLNLLFYKL